MKVAIITDTHFGARKGSKVFHDFFQKFYDDIFFPTLEERGITTCIHMGDAFDNRKNIDFWALNWAKKNVYDRFQKMGIKIYQLVGNHDVYYKNTNEINAVDSLLEDYDNIVAISSPDSYNIGGSDFFMIPWICADNYDETKRKISQTKSQVAFGHLEINGFQAHRGFVMEHGMPKSFFDKFETVFSGHYHTRSNDGKFFYLGNPYEIYWNDVNDRRGFHIFDTETYDFEFIENTYTIFEKIYYDDTNPTLFNANKFKDKHVKILVRKKTNQLQFEKFLDKIIKIGSIDVKIVENFALNDEEVDFSKDEGEDTLTILNKYIEDSDFDLNKEIVKNLMKEVYQQACELD